MFKSIAKWWQPTAFVSQPKERFVELDWLRVLAFGLLVFYHTGMLYTQNWGFHFKSVYLSTEIENLMLLLSPWRMGLIWFISGAALSCLLQKSPVPQFLMSRTVKILLPLLVGVWFVVPIQLYAQMQQEVGLSLSYVEFYIAFFDLSHPLFAQYQAGIWPHVDVNHLWYLRSLWQFTLLLVLMLPVLQSRWLHTGMARFLKLPVLWVYLGLLVPLCVLKLSWPSDTFRYPMGFIFLLYGFLLVHHRAFFASLAQHWRILLGLFVIGYLGVVWGYQSIWLDSQSVQWQITSMDMFYTAQRLLGVMTMLALAMRFLTRTHPILNKLNGWVFPFYILHQSVIIGLAYYFSSLQLGPWLEPTLIILLTYGLCALACWGLSYIALLRPLFGMKVIGKYDKTLLCIGYTLALFLLIPLLFNLLFSWRYML